MRALGAGPAMAMADGLFGVLGAVAAGSLLAVAVAMALSPLAPFGPVRPVYPGIGVSFDWTVLGFGFLLFVVVLTLAALLVAYRVAPHRLAQRPQPGPGSRLEQGGRRGRASPERRTGDALGAGWHARGTTPYPCALRCSAPSSPITVIVTALTFASSLNTLVSQPALYGWNWDYALLAGFSAAENLPSAETTALLDHDPDVAHWAGAYFENVTLDGQSGARAGHEPPRPCEPIHALRTCARCAVTSRARAVDPGVAARARRRHRRGNVDGHANIHLRIVGAATLPTIGGSGEPALQMGTGAVMATSLFSATDLNQQGSPVAGPMAVFITIRPGVSHAAALRSLDHITAVLDRHSDPDAPVGGVVGALRPAEIADSARRHATPALLATVLAAAAIGALGLTLVASVRQRRRQFAVLKALGFTQRQIAASVAWQSSVAAVIGVVLGVPIGIALGRWMWTLFAGGISAVPHPTVPIPSIAAVALGAVVFANLVALLPGRVAARTRTSLLLRAE